MINANKTALDTILRLNLSQGLPWQPADATLFNGAFFEAPTLKPSVYRLTISIILSPTALHRRSLPSSANVEL
jgi:hypothetical protein